MTTKISNNYQCYAWWAVLVVYFFKCSMDITSRDTERFHLNQLWYLENQITTKEIYRVMILKNSLQDFLKYFIENMFQTLKYIYIHFCHHILEFFFSIWNPWFLSLSSINAKNHSNIFIVLTHTW